MMNTNEAVARQVVAPAAREAAAYTAGQESVGVGPAAPDGPPMATPVGPAAAGVQLGPQPRSKTMLSSNGTPVEVQQNNLAVYWGTARQPILLALHYSSILRYEIMPRVPYTNYYGIFSRARRTGGFGRKPAIRRGGQKTPVDSSGCSP